MSSKTFVVFIFFLIFVAGCSTNKHPPVPVLIPLKPVQENVETVSQNTKRAMSDEIERVRAQLRVLQNTDKEKYQKFNNMLVKLSSDKNLFIKVRDNITDDNRNALDSLYSFREKTLFYRVNWAVMDALSLQSED
ncbi:hypothetical protein SKB45_001360 [Salmonella enterica]|uniref:Lipoprotein n=2 Tax=Salmonella enterica TaxID=28901 RepID=A0A5V2DKT3_SALER|nr:hypothetical protein [Salmonella enterica]EBS4769644.1 hypothetical protein [Salmonella enterica subsp. enterica serovar Sandiego]ECH8234996.1 hypothetical protein [Salmonella enterica subsp. enterica]EIB5177263.1 hypothetical protein [Salmonella enterica subsp. enterica serovar Maracaibo]EAB2303329.1 hypothetical protein [Salmonella enterica]EAB4020959.1 hypothetical protein [Salmonella enterica]